MITAMLIIKDFLKPNLRKVGLFALLFVLSSFLAQALNSLAVYGFPLEFYGTYPGGIYGDFTHADLLNFILDGFIWYVISALAIGFFRRGGDGDIKRSEESETMKGTLKEWKKTSLIIIFLLQGGILVYYFITRLANLEGYTVSSSGVLQITVFWSILFLLAILVPVIFSIFILTQVTKIRLVLFIVSVLVIYVIFGSISPFLYEGIGNPDFAFADWGVTGVFFGLPIAVVGLFSSLIFSLKIYKRSSY